MMQSSWKSVLEPVLSIPLNDGILLQSVALASGVTVVNHRLGRKLVGWMVTDRDGAASVYRSAAKNELTLTLTSSGAITVDLFVF